MEKKLVGVGRVQGGRMSYVTADGVGFKRSVSRAVVETKVESEFEVPAFLAERMAKRHAREEAVARASVSVPEFIAVRRSIAPMVEEVAETKQDSKLVKTAKVAAKVYKAIDSFVFPF